MKSQAELELCPGQQQAEQRQPLQGKDDRAVGIAEQDGRGLHANLQVVLAVGHRIVGVVGHRPQQVGEVQQPGRQRHLAGFGHERHGNAPGIGRPQHHLRVVGMALHEGVAGRQGQRAKRQVEGRQVGAQHQQQAEQQQSGEQAQRLALADPPTHQRALVRTRDMPVEVPVGIVVDHATRRTHQYHAADENQQIAPAGHTLGRHPQRPEGRPEQQVDANRAIQAHQLDKVESPRVQAIERLQQLQIHARSPGEAAIIGRHPARSAAGTPRPPAPARLRG